MWIEALLAYLHLGAVLAMVVFATSQAALLRAEWLNAAVLARLVRVNQIYLGSLALLLLTGLLRMSLGVKGLSWYAGQPLVWGKWLGWALLVAASLSPTRAYRDWLGAHQRGAGLPDATALAQVRGRVMGASHAMLLVPLLATLLARGVLVR